MPSVRKVLLWLVGVFIIYAILTSPREAADIAAGVGTVIATGVSNIGEFFNALLSRA